MAIQGDACNPPVGQLIHHVRYSSSDEVNEAPSEGVLGKVRDGITGLSGSSCASRTKNFKA